MAKKIDTYEDKGRGVVIPIMLETKGANAGTFSINWNNQKIETKDLEELKKQLPALVDRVLSMEFAPVIEIMQADVATSAKNGGGFGFTFERFQIARRYDGSWAKRHWLSEEKAPSETYRFRNLSGMPDLDVTLPWTEPTPEKEWQRYNWHPRTVVPYDELLWHRLEAMQKTLRELERQFIAMIGTDEGRAALISGGVAALVASQPRAALESPEEAGDV